MIVRLQIFVESYHPVHGWIEIPKTLYFQFKNWNHFIHCRKKQFERLQQEIQAIVDYCPNPGKVVQVSFSAHSNPEADGYPGKHVYQIKTDELMFEVGKFTKPAK